MLWDNSIRMINLTSNLSGSNRNGSGNGSGNRNSNSRSRSRSGANAGLELAVVPEPSISESDATTISAVSNIPVNLMQATRNAMVQGPVSSHGDSDDPSTDGGNASSAAANSVNRLALVAQNYPQVPAIDRPSRRYSEYSLTPEEASDALEVAIMFRDRGVTGAVGRGAALAAEANAARRGGALRASAVGDWISYVQVLIGNPLAGERMGAEQAEMRAQARQNTGVHQNELDVASIGRRLPAPEPVLLLQDAATAAAAAAAENARLQQIIANAEVERARRREAAAQRRRLYERYRRLNDERLLNRFDERAAHPRSNMSEGNYAALVREYMRRFNIPIMN